MPMLLDLANDISRSFSLARSIARGSPDATAASISARASLLNALRQSSNSQTAASKGGGVTLPPVVH